MNFAKSFAAVLIVSLSGFHAASGAAEPAASKLAAAYKGKPGACYVLLRPNWEGTPHVEGGDYPVCRAVLDNLNKFCDEPPQYERRKLHPTTKNLSEPKWESVDAKANLELVKQTYGAASLPEYRESRWEGENKKVLSLAKSGALALSRADISLSAKGGIQTVYRLDNANPGEKQVGFNQSRLMFSEQGKQFPYKPFDWLSYGGFSDVFAFRNTWFITYFDQYDRWITVKKLTWADPELQRVAAISQCSIQHINDHQGNKQS